jgi:alpha-tubulin N-acetyltransferase 1
VCISDSKTFGMQEEGIFRQTSPMCVLDFYVHESCQRSGVGQALFEWMLHHQQLDPVQLAYDRPSPKMMRFLQKHKPELPLVQQSNSFVVFRGFLECCAPLLP